MLKRHEIQVLRRAGHSQIEAQSSPPLPRAWARISGTRTGALGCGATPIARRMPCITSRTRGAGRGIPGRLMGAARASSISATRMSALATVSRRD